MDPPWHQRSSLLRSTSGDVRCYVSGLVADVERDCKPVDKSKFSKKARGSAIKRGRVVSVSARPVQESADLRLQEDRRAMECLFSLFFWGLGNLQRNLQQTCAADY